MVTQRYSAGDHLVASILADLKAHELMPDARETELLDRAKAAADRIAALEKLVAKEGATYRDQNGTMRPSPLLAEIRSTTLVLARCLNGIQMNPGSVGRDPTKQRAGQRSWAVRSAAMKQQQGA